MRSPEQRHEARWAEGHLAGYRESVKIALETTLHHEQCARSLYEIAAAQEVWEKGFEQSGNGSGGVPGH